MTEADNAIVYVVDDDPSVRRSLSRLLRLANLAVEVFASAREFLDFERPNLPGCIVLDLSMPGESGLDLQDALISKGIPIPIIFVSGHADADLKTRALSNGALDFLEKPFLGNQLSDKVCEIMTPPQHQHQSRRLLA